MGQLKSSVERQLTVWGAHNELAHAASILLTAVNALDSGHKTRGDVAERWFRAAKHKHYVRRQLAKEDRKSK